MGTRSLTILPGESPDEEAAVMYRQMDGYPDGHGDELAAFLSRGQIVNGIPLMAEGEEQPKIFNGPACLAAAVVAHFKDGAGSIYLHPAGTRECGEEYRYTIIAEKQAGFGEAGKIGLKVECVYDGWHTIFEGFVEDFDGEKVAAEENARH